MSIYSPFVQPESVRLELPHGQWILVKKELNAGEARAVVLRAMLPSSNGDAPTLNRALVPHLTMLAYLLDWSFVQPDGTPSSLRGSSTDDRDAAVGALNLQTYSEVLEAIQQHERANTRDREASSADPFVEGGSSPTSTSAG